MRKRPKLANGKERKKKKPRDQRGEHPPKPFKQKKTKTLPHTMISHTPNARLGRTPVLARNNS
jgi:hypothetical protein